MSIPQSIAVAVNQPDESAPLLHHDQNESPPSAAAEIVSDEMPESRKAFFIIVLCTVCVLAIDVGIFMQIAPITRILESIICHSYYERHPDLVGFEGRIPEEMCKISPVQGELAMLKGWSSLFDCLPGIGPSIVIYES